jgi:hypothetical protein
MDVKKANELYHEALLETFQGRDIDKAIVLLEAAIAEAGLSGASWIRQGLLETIFKWFMDSQPTEQNVYGWFRNHYHEHLPEDMHITTWDNNPKHIPDFWMANGDELIPVECKLKEFNDASMRQLQRYMKVYQCERGIAVAPRFTCEIPENIITVQFEHTDLYE